MFRQGFFLCGLKVMEHEKRKNILSFNLGLYLIVILILLGLSFFG